MVIMHIMVANVLLLNLLIALLSATYENVSARANQEWLYVNSTQYYECSSRVMRCTPPCTEHRVITLGQCSYILTTVYYSSLLPVMADLGTSSWRRPSSTRRASCQRLRRSTSLSCHWRSCVVSSDHALRVAGGEAGGTTPTRRGGAAAAAAAAAAAVVRVGVAARGVRRAAVSVAA